MLNLIYFMCPLYYYQLYELPRVKYHYIVQQNHCITSPKSKSCIRSVLEPVRFTYKTKVINIKPDDGKIYTFVLLNAL